VRELARRSANVIPEGVCYDGRRGTHLLATIHELCALVGKPMAKCVATVASSPDWYKEEVG